MDAKFNSELFWNFISFGAIGIIGFLLNIFISIYYRPEILGAFNQAYALFSFFSQIAVFGIHLSVLRQVSEHQNDIKTCNAILWGGVYGVMLLGFPLIVLFWTFIPILSKIFQSALMADQLQWAIAGLPFFVINKILLGYLNGIRKLKIFAILQFLRFALMLIFLLILIMQNSEALTLIFLLSESILSVILLAILLGYKCFSFKEGFSWIARHMHFGRKAFWGNLMADSNNRIDVLMLGLFMSDKIVGIYSFAAILADGFANITVVIRNVMNPIIGKLRFQTDGAALQSLIKGSLGKLYFILVPIGIFVVMIYPFIIQGFNLDPAYLGAWGVLAIIIFGISVASGFLPFTSIFNQQGFPATQSLFWTFVFFSNIILNLIAIPFWGMEGAALSTGCSYAVQVYIIKKLTKTKMNIDI